MNYSLKFVDPEKDQRWDEFALLHPNGTVYHHSTWMRVLLSTYHCKTACIAVEQTLRWVTGSGAVIAAVFIVTLALI